MTRHIKKNSCQAYLAFYVIYVAHVLKNSHFFRYLEKMNEIFLRKIYFFQKSSSTKTDGGGKVIFEISSRRMKIFSKIYPTRIKTKFFQKFTQQRWRQNFTKNLLNKNDEFFLEFWFLLDKHFSEKQKFHQLGWRKNWFLKSGQGSSSKILFLLKKCKNFQREEIKFWDIFLKNFLKFKIFEN